MSQSWKVAQALACSGTSQRKVRSTDPVGLL